MALRIVERKTRRSKASVSISGKFKRLLLFQQSYALMKQRFGKDFDHLQFMVDDDRKGFFWLRPCAASDQGATPMTMTGNNRVFSVSALLHELGWKKKETVAFDLDYDAKNGAWFVNTNAPLALPSTREA